MLIRPLPASEDKARDALMDLRRTHRETYAGLSRLLDRPDEYLADWVRRGRPEVLPIEDKHALARYFGVSPELLGAPFDDE